nr:alpha/beta fold hydrolase [Comamonas serinivorans]
MWGVVSAPNPGAAAADARAEGRTSRPPGSVALVHGWADHGGVWRDWAQALATQGWRVLVPDLLGHGLSDKPRRAGGLTAEQVGQALAQWLWAQGWAGEGDAAHPQPGVAAGQPRAADAPRAAPAGPCVLIADRSVAGAVHAAWRALAQRAQGSGQADAWRRVARLRWVSRPTLREALAMGADAGAGAERAAVDRRLTDAFPATPATLARLLALLEGHGLRSGPESRHEWQYGCNAVDQETTMAPYPDAGHLVRCRDWVRRLRAGGDAVAMGRDAEALLERMALDEAAGGVASLPVPAPRKVLDVPLFGPRWPWTDPVQAAMARLRDGG